MKLTVLLSLFIISCFGRVTAQQVNWSEDIACILYSHCTSCHNPGGIAPFSLLTYSDAVAHQLEIQDAVVDGHMPPMPGKSSTRHYAGENTLSQSEINLINDWITNGKPQGNISNAPVAPTYTNSSQLPVLDYTAQIPTYTNPVAGYDDYRCFVIPTSFTTEKWIKGFEVIPGNYDMVHHIQIFQDTSNICHILDSLDAGLGYTYFGDAGSLTNTYMGVWLPGQGPQYYPDGMAIKLLPNANIIIQVHYPDGTTGQTDSTKVNFMFESGTPREVFFNPILDFSTSTLIDGPLYIPANTVKTFHLVYQLPYDLTLLSAMPHMHLIGRSINTYAVTPANDTISLVDIPDWHFHWQMNYPFDQPIKLPVGTTLYSEATYDNTTNNPDNPNNPPENIYAGESTDDEMMMVFFGYTGYVTNDENIIVDSLDHYLHYLNCSPVNAVGLEEAFVSENFTVYPVPASDKFHLNFENLEFVTISVIDRTGKVIQTQMDVASGAEIRVENAVSGLYLLLIQDQATGKTISKKLSVLK
jgi:hypothetical protein